MLKTQLRLERYAPIHVVPQLLFRGHRGICPTHVCCLRDARPGLALKSLAKEKCFQSNR